MCDPTDDSLLWGLSVTPRLYAIVSAAVTDALVACGYPACRTRLFVFQKRLLGTLFNADKPMVIVSKGNVARQKECRGAKQSIVGLRITIRSPEDGCQKCDTASVDAFDNYVDEVHACLCQLDICLPDPYEWGGFDGQSQEADDIESTRTEKTFETTLDMNFRVCEITED